MIDFIEYIVSEIKQKRLSKENALSLIKQFSKNSSKNKSKTAIHPLLHTNTSSLYEQSYSTTFTGEEPFLKDHQVRFQDASQVKIVPGVAYLEMAREALKNALPNTNEASVIELEQVVWLAPFFVTENKELSIVLNIEEEETVSFEIFSLLETERDVQEVTHCEGKLRYISNDRNVALEIEPLKERMKRGILLGSDVYKAYDALGLVYGTSHQVIKEIYQGTDEVFAELELPEEIFKNQNAYMLHPGMVDGALQTSIGLINNLAELQGSPMMPFALENIQIFKECTSKMYVWVRYAEGSSKNTNVVKLNIDLCDSEGTVCVQLKGFTSKTFTSTTPIHSVSKKTPSSKAMYATQKWELLNSEELKEYTDFGLFGQHEIITYNQEKAFVKQLKEAHSKAKIAEYTFEKSEVATYYKEVSLECFESIQQILKSKPQKPVFFQLVVPNTTEDSILAGIAAMLKTASIENPNFFGQLVFIENTNSLSKVGTYLKIKPTIATVVKFEEDKAYALRLKEVEVATQKSPIAFKEQGVYIITGGLGGLGIVFTEEILAQTNTGTIVITGRSAMNAQIQEKLNSLANHRNRVVYRQLDLLKAEEVLQCIHEIKRDYKQLNGILHTAGMIADNYILKKTKQEFTQVIAPKITGTSNLYKAVKNLDLDFIMLFSSGVSVLGNPGQADYALANGFLDHYATYIQQTAGSQKVVSVNWPLWEEGGMHIDNEVKEQLQRTTGINPMQTFTGKEAFYRSLALNIPQMLVVEGNVNRVRQIILNEKTQQSEPKKVDLKIVNEKISKEVLTTDIAEKTKEYLRKQFSTVLKIAVHKIDTSAALERYGIDSVVAMNLTGQLEKTFGTLSKTLFFEYQTIDELSEYIASNFQEKLAELFSLETSKPTEIKEKSVALKPATPTRTENKTHRRRRFAEHTSLESTSTKKWHDEPIAIVGLSGRYPESENIEAFWNNLKDGKDCVTEVPKSRWDWRDFYNGDSENPGAHTSKWGGFINGVDEFDPRFFNISPREASYIDPQERLFLQHAWMAMEDAGLTRDSLQIPMENDQAGQVGVYVGVMYGEYNLSGSLASIANRVSYVLNVHGPSMTLDTMCSSSLTAIHLACQDIKSGRTSLAIAGGVNVSIDPNKYSILSSSRFLSSEGQCQSFGEGGDGYIPGEGVGAVILKRLSEAERDKNHIYGIIKGTALNHGGKTNGYTVPNPQAQAAAISRALKESGVSPEHISYVEAHGTGTKLGDPIEIAALTKAYQIDKERTCWVGSSKSNIGHCESAAGIAGFTKVLLQMQHQQIAPSLHSTHLNPNIDFESTPFKINQTLRSWDKPKVNGQEIPRIAGLSSFGAGGSNAHIIIQEYEVEINNTAEFTHVDEEVIIPLSARTNEQLKEKAIALYQFIEKTKNNLNLVELAYTLQVGREAMDERLGLLTSSKEQLLHQLKGYIQGEFELEDVYEGSVQKNRETISLFNKDADFQETITKWIAQKKYAKLLELWVKGLHINWNVLYAEEKIQLISLPTYPFAKEQYWITPEQRGKIVMKEFGNSVVHPLVHRNTSNLEQQKFSSVFQGSEFFMKDYALKLQKETAVKAIPAMTGLEMARAAIEQATPESYKGYSFELRNISWGQPMIFEKDKQFDINVFKEGEQQVDFEIATREKGEETIYAQGEAVYVEEQELFQYELVKLKSQLQSIATPTKEWYQVLEEQGLVYGETNQILTEILRGEEQLLAKIQLPAVLETNYSDFVIHPSILESCIQASTYLLGNFELGNTNIVTPVALDTLKILEPTKNVGYVWVRYANTENCVNIDVLDEEGIINAQIIGLKMQPIVLQKTNKEATNTQRIELLEFPVLNLKKPNNIQLTLASNHSLIAEVAVSEKPSNIQLATSLSVEGTSIPQERFKTKKISLKEIKESQGNSVAVSKKMVKQKSTTPVLKEKETTNSSVGTKEELKTMLVSTLAAALYLETSEVDADKSFIDLGLDSIVGVEWIKTINKKLQIELSSTKIYDYATVNALAGYIYSELTKKELSLVDETATIA